MAGKPPGTDTAEGKEDEGDRKHGKKGRKDGRKDGKDGRRDGKGGTRGNGNMERKEWKAGGKEREGKDTDGGAWKRECAVVGL